MILSFLIPTRNGGDYLEACLRAVLAQDADLEVVVADNANEDRTPEVLRGFAADPRLKVVRAARALTVTENWNAALTASSGDYIVMLGDDDLLLPAHARTVQRLVLEHDRPDCITHDAYGFVAAQAIPGLATSHYAERLFRYGPEFVHGEILSPSLRRSVVREMFRFRPRIALNMQTTVVSRAAASRIPGGMFKPPFPDHYALNALLLTAGRWLYHAEPLVVVGISAKSFGHFVYGGEQGRGLRYLGIDTTFPGRLAGNELLNAMYVWLLLLKEDFPDELADVQIGRGDYVVRQLWAVYREWRLGRIALSELLGRMVTVPIRDWVKAATLLGDEEIRRAAVERIRLRRSDPARHFWHDLQPAPGVENIAAFASWIAGRSPIERR